MNYETSPFILHPSSFILSSSHPRTISAFGDSIASQIASRLRRGPSGFIAVDGDFRTSLRGVFAGGDAVSGEGTIVQSVAHGKGAARAMDNYLTRT